MKSHLPIKSILLVWTLCFGVAHTAKAISINGGPTLSGSPVTSETGLSNGVTVQVKLDADGEVAISFFDVSSNQVGSVIQTVSGNVTTPVFWNALWLIGGDFGRHNGTYSYQVTPSTADTSGTARPPLGDSSASFTIDSMDIHGLTVTPSLDANQQPTFPYRISYALAKTSLVTAQITDSSSTVVRTLFTDQRQAGEATSTATITWNGMRDDGRPASIGTYTVTVSAKNPNNAADTATPRTRSIDVFSLAGSAANAQKLFEDNVFVYPNPVRNGQGIFQMQAIREGATLSLKIYTISGDLVNEQSFPGVAAGNIQTYTWNMINQAGRKVGRGLYYYVVREEDSTGTLQTVKKMAVLP